MLVDVGGGVDLIPVETLGEGLRLIDREHVDVIVLDLSLPDSQGIETFRRAHETIPDVPFVVLTGIENNALAAIAVREGAQDFHTKGHIDGLVLARSLRYAVERQRARSELTRSEATLRESRGRLEMLVDERTAELVRVNEELEAATQAKSRFLANMSHELRTPLNSILGFTGVILQGLSGDITQEQRDQLEMVRKSGLRLLALINDVLDISRIEAGRTVLECDDLDVAPLLGSCVETVTPLAAEKGLHLRVVLPEVRLHMYSDETKIHQVVLNLLANAVKFTDAGSVTLEARTCPCDMVEFRVTDTGIGIPPEDLERVFGEFAQVPSEGVQAEGSGLGLAISRRLAAVLGGDVVATSEPGVGSTFILRVPRRCPEPDGNSSIDMRD
jgi:signal transduction histidine kinase